MSAYDTNTDLWNLQSSAPFDGSTLHGDSMEDDADRIARAGKLWRRTPRSKIRLLPDQGGLLGVPEVGPAFQRCDQSGKSDMRPSVVGGDNRLILALLTADTSR